LLKPGIDMTESENPESGGRAAFAYPDFRHYLQGRSSIVLGLEMQSVAVGWQVYEITHRTLDLGLVGLAQFLPGFFLFLAAGHASDHFDRRQVLNLCAAGFTVCSILLLVLAWQRNVSVYAIYGVLVLLGGVRSFNGAASQAFLPELVPEVHFPSAVAWGASTRTASTILGPVLGGLIYAFFHGAVPVYVASVAAGLVAQVETLSIKTRSRPRVREEVNLSTILAGFRYIWSQKLILGSISLDLFAVLLGGAVALLPVYAREILETGPWGLGLLRSAPGVGAAIMAAALAYRPLRRRSGVVMLWCVAGFGTFTVIFAVSRSLWLSLVSLVLVGATDMVSVIIRLTLIQLATPNEMRGRVSAVNMLFIGASNEFGQFESGVTAHWLGTVPAVLLGGLGTLVVTALWAWGFPELRHADRLEPGSVSQR
jgi:MFS family permease